MRVTHPRVLRVRGVARGTPGKGCRPDLTQGTPGQPAGNVVRSMLGIYSFSYWLARMISGCSNGPYNRCTG
jgi:hypothetical protein